MRLLPGSLSDFPVFLHPGMSRWNDYGSPCANGEAGMVKNGKSTPANCVIRPSQSLRAKAAGKMGGSMGDYIYYIFTKILELLVATVPSVSMGTGSSFFRVGNLCSLDRMMGTFNMLQVAKLWWPRRWNKYFRSRFVENTYIECSFGKKCEGYGPYVVLAAKPFLGAKLGEQWGC